MTQAATCPAVQTYHAEIARKKDKALLEIARIPVDATKLCIGMYVTALDRPWLETPFVFQGFEIRDRIEIEQLQSYCGYVYVDVERGKLSEAQIRALQTASTRKRFPQRPLHADESRPDGWLRRFLARFGLDAWLATRVSDDSRGYRISSTVRREAPAAREAYESGVERFRQVQQGARLEGRIDREAVLGIVEPVIDSVLRNPDAMAWTVFSKKRGARNYSRALATSVWSILFGRHLGFDRAALRDLGTGGLLLDIGNVVLPSDILNSAGAITPGQYELVTRHVNAGLDILHASGGFEERIVDMVRHHHERNDGSGYPEGLRGNQIPVYGRIAGIVDCYDAMTTKTAYSPALAAYDAARELNGMRDREFQAEVVEQFLQTIGMFPTGSVVELSDGRLGVVLEQNRARPLLPKLMLVMDKHGGEFDEPQILDMAELDRAGQPVAAWIAKGHEHGAFGIDPHQFFN